MKKILILLLSLFLSVGIFAQNEQLDLEYIQPIPEITGEYQHTYPENLGVNFRGEVVDYDVHVNLAAQYILRMFSDVTEDLSGNGFVDDIDPDDAGMEWGSDGVAYSQQWHSSSNSADNCRMQSIFGAFMAYDRSENEDLVTMIYDTCEYISSYAEFLDENVTMVVEDNTITSFSYQSNEPINDGDSHIVGGHYDAWALLQAAELAELSDHSSEYRDTARELIINSHYNKLYAEYTNIGDYLFQARGETPQGMTAWDFIKLIEPLLMLHEQYPDDDIFDSLVFDPNSEWDSWLEYAETCFSYIVDSDYFPDATDATFANLNGSGIYNSTSAGYGLSGLIWTYAIMGDATGDTVTDYTAVATAIADWVMDYWIFEEGEDAGAYKAANVYNFYQWQTIPYFNRALGILDYETYEAQINRSTYIIAKGQDLETGCWLQWWNDKHNPVIAGENIFGLAYNSGYNEVWVATTNGNDSNDGSESSPFATIQKGIDYAAGGIVHIEAGTYQEDLVMYHTCKLVGEEGVIIQPTSITDDYVTDQYAAITIINTPNIGKGVVLDNLEIDLSLLYDGDYANLEGIMIYNADAILRNIDIDVTTNDGNADYAVFAYDDDGVSDVSISNSSFAGFNNAGIYLSHAGIYSNVSNCTITGIGSTGIGIKVNSTSEETVLLDNEISECGTGIYVEGVTGIEVTGNTVITTYSRATGTGLQLATGTTSADIEFNTLAELNIALQVDDGAGEGNKANYNNLNDCDTGIFYNDDSDFDAQYNYFGGTTTSVGGTGSGAVDNTNPLANPFTYITAPDISFSGDQITIDWDDVSGAESYNVYTCSTADGTYESLANVGSSSFFHTPNTTTLYYKVSYIDESSAESPLSPASGFVNYSYTYSAGNTNNVFIAYGFDMGYTTASEFVEYEIGTANCSVISKWNSSYQAWQSATYLDGFGWDGDFDLVRGGTYMLGFNSNANVYIYGAVESNPTYNFVLTDYTDINSLMVPLDNIICSNASDLGNVINDGSNRVTTLSQWISDGQGWHTATYISEIDYWVGDFEISVGQPLMIGVEANFEWPEE